jgi:hypothetical protein
MSSNHIDYEAVRDQVERRLAPRIRLLRRRWWLFAHIAIFLTIMAFIHVNDHTGSLFYYSTSGTVATQSFPDPGGGTPITIPEYTYINWQPYPLVSFISAIWFIVLILHVLNIWMAFGRERLIQREMDREIELERMRLQLELAHATGMPADDHTSEKPKRLVRLSDDGELLHEEIRGNTNRHRS